MTSRWTLSAVAGATIALGLLLHAGLVDAQRRGGGGAAARGGVSRQSPAAGGSFSQRSRPATPAQRPTAPSAQPSRTQGARTTPTTQQHGRTTTQAG
jgi:hypothetical protein